MCRIQNDRIGCIFTDKFIFLCNTIAKNFKKLGQRDDGKSVERQLKTTFKI